ncbi:MAG: Lrp/AsnC family transcriptional regulator [Ruminococcus sp.]|nr:Lrp/AsnC family transcriptional regulator [Ruminococcus sp.]
MEKLLNILRSSARMPVEEIAVMLGRTPEQVKSDIAELESRGVIKGYAAIVDETVADPDSVTALIELKVTPQSQSGYDEIAAYIASFEQVESVRLMSGAYDILVSVTGTNIREVSRFVAENLAAIEAVQSTATHFLLRNYKLGGIMIAGEEQDERGLVSP